MPRIASPADLTRFLDELNWLQDAFCDAVTPAVEPGVTPERVEVQFRDRRRGGNEPGDAFSYRRWRLLALRVREWSCAGDRFDFGSGHSMEEADIVETADGFGLTFDVPTPVRLVADCFEYERLPDEHGVVQAWTSDTRLTITAPRGALPSPAAWVAAFAREETDVTWRLYDGPVFPTEHVYADYTGFFLERPARLTENTGGLFVSHISEDADGLYLAVERHGADDQLWRAFCRVAARLLRGGIFHSGNLHFAADEWLARQSGE